MQGAYSPSMVVTTAPVEWRRNAVERVASSNLVKSGGGDSRQKLNDIIIPAKNMNKYQKLLRLESPSPPKYGESIFRNTSRGAASGEFGEGVCTTNQDTPVANSTSIE